MELVYGTSLKYFLKNFSQKKDATRSSTVHKKISRTYAEC